MKRRLALGALSVAAAGLGVGLALWRERGSDDGSAELWAARFATPDGGMIEMGRLRGKPLLLNFWATWCPPCVTEMPLLDAFARARADWNVLALAVDAPDPVRRFISERRLELPVALAPDTGLDLGRRLGNTAGGLPFSIVFDVSGKPAHRKLGAVDERLLAEWTRTIR